MLISLFHAVNHINFQKKRKKKKEKRRRKKWTKTNIAPLQSAIVYGIKNKTYTHNWWISSLYASITTASSHVKKGNFPKYVKSKKKEKENRAMGRQIPKSKLRYFQIPK